MRLWTLERRCGKSTRGGFGRETHQQKLTEPRAFLDANLRMPLPWRHPIDTRGTPVRRNADLKQIIGLPCEKVKADVTCRVCNHGISSLREPLRTIPPAVKSLNHWGETASREFSSGLKEGHPAPGFVRVTHDSKPASTLPHLLD